MGRIKHNKIRIILHIAAALFLVLLLASLVKGWLISPAPGKFPDAKTLAEDVVWEERQAEGDYREYTYTIPNTYSGEMVLSMENCWTTMEILLDDRIIYAYEDKYYEGGISRHWINLSQADRGKTVVLRLSGLKELVERTAAGNAYLGAKDAVFIRFFKENLYALLFGVFTLLLSIVVICAGLVFRKKITPDTFKAFLSLAAFVLTTGIWVASDSQLSYLATERFSIVSLISFLSFMIMPVFFLQFIQALMIQKKKIFDILCGIVVMYIAICLTLYLLRLVPIYRTIFVMHILLGATIVIVLREGIKEIRDYNNLEIRRVVIGFAVLSVFSVIALILFYVNPTSAYSYVYCAGILIFVMFLANSALAILFYHLGRSANTAMYRELAYEDIMTHLGNRTAFLEEQIRTGSEPDLAYVMLDINNLKQINDEHGHSEGDRLIKDAAACIRDSFGGIGRCFRIGGDEFTVIIKGTSHGDIKDAINHFEERVKECNEVREIPLEIACGYAMQNSKRVSTRELFKRADANMYLKKEKMKTKSQ